MLEEKLEDTTFPQDIIDLTLDDIPGKETVSSFSTINIV